MRKSTSPSLRSENPSRPAGRGIRFFKPTSFEGALLSRQILENSPDGVLAFDREYRYVLWNPAMERISGLKHADVIGKNAFELFPFLKQTHEDQYFKAALLGKQTAPQDTTYMVAQTGRQGYFQASYAPLRDGHGRIIGGMEIVRETTKRKNAELALKKSKEDLEAQLSESNRNLVEIKHAHQVETVARRHIDHDKLDP